MDTLLFWINNNVIIGLALLLDIITIVIYISNYIKRKFSSGIWELATFFYLYYIVFLIIHNKVSFIHFILLLILLTISRCIFYYIGRYLYTSINSK